LEEEASVLAESQLGQHVVDVEYLGALLEQDAFWKAGGPPVYMRMAASCSSGSGGMIGRPTATRSS